MKSYFFLLLIGVVVLGCQPKTISIADTSLPTKGKFEVVWVNPQILYSDSLSTLICAQRLDSLFVRSSEHSLGDVMPTVTFEVTKPTCDISAAIVDIRNKERASLFQRTVTKGNYKLTLDPEQYQKLSIGGTEQLKVRLTLCGVVSTHTPAVASPAQ